MNFPVELPVFVNDDNFLYPLFITPLIVEDKANIKALELAMQSNKQLLVVSSIQQGFRDFNSVYHSGVIGTILRHVPLPDSKVKILLECNTRGKIIKQTQQEPFVASVDRILCHYKDEKSLQATMSLIKDKIKILAKHTNYFSPEHLNMIEQSNEYLKFSDLVLNSLKLPNKKAYEFFILDDLEIKFYKLFEYIMQEIELSKLQKSIKSKVYSRIEKVNKEYFLKEQLKQIQKELGTDVQRDEEIEEYKEKLAKKEPFMNEDAIKEIKKQIEKFSRMHPDSADASLLQSYLDWVLDIPFEHLSKKKPSIKDVSDRLELDHYALKKPKERIVEYFAIKELLDLRGIKNKSKGEILCFIGPPGVGKTSLANSIATALDRALIRIALGGLEDVNELRGHRRTYIGAMPGRIVQGLIESKQMNPVFVLDEIDKVAKSFRGDPTAVLLEVLDPEQNNKYRDYYLNFNIDLSKIVFIATANDISSIPAALRDRMEFINLNSYTPQEKFQIAKKYLILQELKKHGLKINEVNITKLALEKIINDYTRESGVRNLRRRIADILRKVGKEILINPQTTKVSINIKNLSNYLEKTIFEIDKITEKKVIGLVNGLAWTRVGGDVLKIEAIKTEGKGNMKITGYLGEVMKESASIAFSVIKALIDQKKLEIDIKTIPLNQKEKEENKQVLDASEIYRRYDLHIHVPEGATPKDGPSAGITLATAIASILSNKSVNQEIAMTGELTLLGKVLPIGGLKEKLIAAYKAGIKTALIPEKNYQRDLDEIPLEVTKEMKILPVENIKEVLKYALL